MSATAWQEQAKDDITTWAVVMPDDADGEPIDWAWVRGLDLAGGIGAVMESAAPSAAGGDGAVAAARGLDAQGLHDALKADYATRDWLEAVIAQCSAAFMGDFDRVLPSYRLPRALAYANRRLCDEIRLLLRLGEERRLWRAETERIGRERAVVLHPVDESAESPVPLDDLVDRSAAIAQSRAERRERRRGARRGSDTLMARASLAGVSAHGTDAAEKNGPGHGPERAGRPYPSPDWRDAYLPGRGIDVVMGIDIETTGTDPARDSVLDAGFEYMAMASSRPADAPVNAIYLEPGYEAGDAYGQARLSFGVTPMAAAAGNPFITRLTGIDISRRGDGSLPLFDEWPAAQRGLLARLVAQPYVAHNATFEHKFLMLNVAGYAEAYRAGEITIVDTLPMSRQWDPGSAPDDAHPYGDNTLDAYAKRQGALPADAHERHLGLEDAHIMLVAMKHHLAALKAAGRGPWGPGGRAGEGGKRIGRR